MLALTFEKDSCQFGAGSLCVAGCQHPCFLYLLNTSSTLPTLAVSIKTTVTNVSWGVTHTMESHGVKDCTDNQKRIPLSPSLMETSLYQATIPSEKALGLGWSVSEFRSDHLSVYDYCLEAVTLRYTSLASLTTVHRASSFSKSLITPFWTHT